MGQCAQSAIGEITSYWWDFAQENLSLPIEWNLDLGLKKSRLRVENSQKDVSDKWKEVSNQGGGYLWVWGVIQDVGITFY